MASDDLDARMRLAAFEHVRRLTEPLTSRELGQGFLFEGERILLLNRPRGIFKPRQMQYLLSIKTVFPRHGRRVWYDDQRNFDQEVHGSHAGEMDYAFMGTNPNSPSNQLLKEAYEKEKPIIYFRGVAPERYVACIPTFISNWDPDSLKARIIFGFPGQKDFSRPKTLESRKYVYHNVKQRIHQASFREALREAYKDRCALSGLPENRLLDAAHIIPDQDEQLGQPIVPNGLLLSKIHHAAFDQHLIGINDDYQVCVSDRLLKQHDGATLKALTRLNGKQIYLPDHPEDYPDSNRLKRRFELFKEANAKMS